MTRFLLIGAGLALPLAACSETGPAAKATASADAMNQMDMPDGTPADMNAVPLYPGSKMVDMKIMPHLADDAMTVNFDSPVTPDLVRAWYLAELPKKGFAVAAEEDGIAGKGPDGHTLRITLEAAPDGHTLGAIIKG